VTVTVREDESEVQPVSGRPVTRLTDAALIGAGVALAVFVGQHGTPGWQLLRVAVVAALTVAALAVQRRASDRTRGACNALIGVVAISVGVGFLPHLVKAGVTVTAIAALLELAAGITLVVTGTAALVHGRRLGWRLLVGVGMLVVTVLAAWVVSPAIMATNVPRPEIDATPASRGLRYDDVMLKAPDGVRLAAWYVPSRNEAAIVVLHGAGSTRSDALDEAAVLARHGFGVLLVDARGHGESEGQAMDFGWHGDDDIAAATRFLADRADVDPTRIGLLGLSMGGEEAIGASAVNPRIRAVVAEGATARSAGDQAWLSDEHGLAGALQEQLSAARDVLTDVLSDASPPTTLRDAVRAARQARFLMIAAGDVTDESDAASYVRSGAPARVESWTVPGAGHTEGLDVKPGAWERRVVGFFSRTLGVTPVDGEPDAR
jgi:dienelactone hydrolase